MTALDKSLCIGNALMAVLGAAYGNTWVPLINATVFGMSAAVWLGSRGWQLTGWGEMTERIFWSGVVLLGGIGWWLVLV